ncbi:MAG TPA: NADH-quinone oxidoreductase chain 5 [Bacteroidales bacterium]|nr:MAG: hypothetical protein A2X11_14605 [Bacteroidetes bacterium GWE2_42_24]OFY31582.1 MAG: hypothetical protein A2X09_08345 [Bacteroidetes bacterium GWF2_43_11]PKP23900.1 MAG: NADH-quinone oxidoreductase chain 5 [Bacteroidetes bacterium HGW-Bacteroidetes-22]HAQ64385.1 NADH-quinone oxidoreductase chain 5 [Bacteroidales bacterium]HBZ67165.1 NADH-quinone oxidoreductase chain 5 [Bacteroidales bacterium]
MNQTDIANYIGNLFPEAIISRGPQFPTIEIPPEKLITLCRKLRDDEQLAFDYLFCLSGVDMPDHMTVVYHLESTWNGHCAVVKTHTTDRKNPVIDSVNDIWPTAGFHEREAFDLLGIRFNNHPDLRRLFLDDSWGFPLRKDYTDPARIVER